MIPLDRAVVAKLESHGERFEVLVDPDLAVKVRQGEKLEIEDVVAADNIFENSSHGTRASEESLQKVFHTTDFHTIARRIIEKGEIHLTAEQRRQMIAEKRKQVITFIARNAVNPQTGHPHPPQRIEMAMEEARVNIDPFKHLDELVKETVKALRPSDPNQVRGTANRGEDTCRLCSACVRGYLGRCGHRERRMAEGRVMDLRSEDTGRNPGRVL